MKSNNTESQEWKTRLLKPVIPTLLAQGFVGPCLILKNAGQAGEKGSPLHILRKVWQQEGVKGLYRGNGWNFAKTLPNAVLVVNFTDINMQVVKPFLGNPLLAAMVCAPFSGMFEMAMTVPAEAYERSKQTHKPISSASISMQYLKLWKTMASRNAVGTAGTFIGRETLKILEKYREISPLEKIMFLTTAGLVTAAATVPFDALVRRAYVSDVPASFSTLVCESVKELGWRGTLTAGWRGRILSAGFPIIANQFSAFWIDRTSSKSLEANGKAQQILLERHADKNDKDKGR